MTQQGQDNEPKAKRFVFPSDLASTREPKRAAVECLLALNYSEEEVFAVKLALEEALTNAVKHGNRNDHSKHVTLTYTINTIQAVFSVQDEGDGFSPHEVPDCTSPDRLPLPSGRGILLIQSYMDEVCYKDNGREIYFVKRRATQESQGG